MAPTHSLADRHNRARIDTTRVQHARHTHIKRPRTQTTYTKHTRRYNTGVHEKYIQETRAQTQHASARKHTHESHVQTRQARARKIHTWNARADTTCVHAKCAHEMHAQTRHARAHETHTWNARVQTKHARTRKPQAKATRRAHAEHAQHAKPTHNCAQTQHARDTHNTHTHTHTQKAQGPHTQERTSRAYTNASTYVSTLKFKAKVKKMSHAEVHSPVVRIGLICHKVQDQLESWVLINRFHLLGRNSAVGRIAWYYPQGLVQSKIRPFHTTTVRLRKRSNFPIDPGLVLIGPRKTGLWAAAARSIRTVSSNGHLPKSENWFAIHYTETQHDTTGRVGQKTSFFSAFRVAHLIVASVRTIAVFTECPVPRGFPGKPLGPPVLLRLSLHRRVREKKEGREHQVDGQVS